MEEMNQQLPEALILIPNGNQLVMVFKLGNDVITMRANESLSQQAWKLLLEARTSFDNQFQEFNEEN